MAFALLPLRLPPSVNLVKTSQRGCSQFSLYFSQLADDDTGIYRIEAVDRIDIDEVQQYTATHAQGVSGSGCQTGTFRCANQTGISRQPQSSSRYPYGQRPGLAPLW